MPLITESFDSLPYIDQEPTSTQRAAAQALIDAELSAEAKSEPLTHPLLPPPPSENFSQLIQAEHDRIAAKLPFSGGVDLSRYEALEPPATSPDSDERHPETLDLWRAALQKAYTSHVYLSGRYKNLTALQENGKDEWLKGNEELVDELKRLEKELADRKEEIDLLAVARRNAQESAAGELTFLEKGWKDGVGKVLETELAAEELRIRILEARRGGAV